MESRIAVYLILILLLTLLGNLINPTSNCHQKPFEAGKARDVLSEDLWSKHFPGGGPPGPPHPAGGDTPPTPTPVPLAQSFRPSLHSGAPQAALWATMACAPKNLKSWGEPWILPVLQPWFHIITSKINARDIICELATSNSIAKIINSLNNSVLQYVLYVLYVLYVQHVLYAA